MAPDLAQIRNMLRVNKHRLDDELEIQPEIQERISTEVARLGAKAAELKDVLARVESVVAGEIKEDDPKLPATMLDGQVKRNRKRLEAWSAYQQTKLQHEEWTGMLTAWQQRGYTIKTLADLYGYQYFSPDSTYNIRATTHRRDVPDEVARQSLRRAVNAAPLESVEVPSRPRRRSIVE